MTSGGPPTLIYDGTCPVCSGAADWVVTNTPPGAVELLPCQSEEREQRFPLVSYAECMAAVQLVEPDGTVRSGADAVPPLLRLTKWHWLAPLIGAPGGRHLAALTYSLVAPRRQGVSKLLRLSRTHVGESCGEESCSDDNA